MNERDSCCTCNITFLLVILLVYSCTSSSCSCSFLASALAGQCVQCIAMKDCQIVRRVRQQSMSKCLLDMS